MENNMENSNFKYFSKNMFQCLDAFKHSLGMGMKAVREMEDHYRLFYWLNSYCGWMQLEPIVYEAIIVLVDNNDPDIQDQWHEKMKHMPVMRIKIVPTAVATSSFGPGIASFDNIQISYYDGVDLHDYDEKVQAWKEKVFDKETGKLREDVSNYNIEVYPQFGKELCSFVYDGETVYEKEEAIYNGICDGSIFKKLIEMNNSKTSNVLKEDPLK
jgi:hypothetical protein